MADVSSPSPASPSRSEIIKQISQTLGERRQLRGLTYEKVSQALKIRIFFLKALEHGEWDQLPAEVYLRGFIRRYAQYLGLDSEKLLAPYIQATDSPSALSKPITSMTAINVLSKTGWIWLGIVVIVFLVLVRFIRMESSPQPKPRESIPMKAIPTETKPKEPSLGMISSDPNQHRLEMYSVYPLWMRVTSKDKAFEGFISQGTTWTWKGEGNFSIRLGHTREVTMVFDGHPVFLQENQKKIDLP